MKPYVLRVHVPGGADVLDRGSRDLLGWVRQGFYGSWQAWRVPAQPLHVWQYRHEAADEVWVATR